MATKTFAGKTGDAGSYLLGAKFWRPGVKLDAIYIRSYMTENGECQEFLLVNPQILEIKVDAKTKKLSDSGESVKVDRFGMGNLTGYQMALQAAQFSGMGKFQYQDRVSIRCIGLKKSEIADQSDRPDFEILVERDEKNY